MKKLSKILLIGLFATSFAFAADVRLAWDPNEEPDVNRYRVYYTTNPTVTTSDSYVEVTGRTTTTVTVTNLANGQTYYFAATALNTSDQESLFSNTVSTTIPDEPVSAPENLRITIIIP